MEPLTFTGSVQLCFSVEQHVCTLLSLELLLYVRLPDGGHCGVVQVKPVATLLSDRKRGREKLWRKVIITCPAGLFSFKILQDFSLWIKYCFSCNTVSLSSESLVSAGDDGPEGLVCSPRLGGLVTGLGGLAFNATREPFDTNIKTSLWDCRN